jgi:hypothetical protein
MRGQSIINIVLGSHRLYTYTFNSLAAFTLREKLSLALFSKYHAVKI